MKHKFTFFLLILCLLFFYNSFAQQDSIPKLKSGKKIFGGAIIKISDTLWYRVYNPEQGYFQKANFDKSDPRFMIANENLTFKFGIGGDVKVVMFTDFAGTIDNNDFVTSLIPIPTNNYRRFKVFANYSRLNIKVVGKIKNNPIVSFIEGSFGGTNNAFKLRHAYVSFLGLTIGQTWSTFMDLQASPFTIDGEGPSNQIGQRHPLLRYTYYHKDKFQFAFAAEMPEISMVEISDEPHQIYKQNQHVPDLITHFKFQGKFGHIQLGAILRIMNYGDSTVAKKSVFMPGGGLALSGTFNLWKNATLHYQIDGGKGIASYIQDLAYLDCDLLPSLNRDNKMNTAWMYGGFIALQQFWTKKLQSNIMYGITRLEAPKNNNLLFGVYAPWYYKYGHYFAVNTFWNFFDFATLGIEYVWGERVNLDGAKGYANRFNLLFQYHF
jgi:hypothetical protein